MAEDEWKNGPASRQDCNPFASLDDIQPSRFALAYGPIELIRGQRRVNIGFLALDPERLGDGVDDGQIQDFGDNCLNFYLPETQRKKGTPILDNRDDDSSSSSSSSSSDDDSDDEDDDDEVVAVVVAPASGDDDNSDDNNDDDNEGAIPAHEAVIRPAANDEEKEEEKEDEITTQQRLLSTLISPSILKYLQYKDDSD
jgi:hypothetical protein